VIILILIAVLGTLVQLAHRLEREQLHLAHHPGTIASAVSIGAQTHIGALLAGRQRDKDIEAAMRNRRFRINERTMQIVSNDEPAYEEAANHGPVRRKSILQYLANGPKGV